MKGGLSTKKAAGGELWSPLLAFFHYIYLMGGELFREGTP